MTLAIADITLWVQYMSCRFSDVPKNPQPFEINSFRAQGANHYPIHRLYVNHRTFISNIKNVTKIVLPIPNRRSHIVRSSLDLDILLTTSYLQTMACGLPPAYPTTSRCHHPLLLPHAMDGDDSSTVKKDYVYPKQAIDNLWETVLLNQCELSLFVVEIVYFL
jgi:hypothetical protein